MSDRLAEKRNLVLVSGYYGFDNLGDEALLEQITEWLKALVRKDQIVVISANPEKTSATYDVQALNRWQLAPLLAALSRCSLLISGGGGLFQDTRSCGSTVFYGSQILLARLLGARAVALGQGIGPLRSALGKWATRLSCSLCDEIVVRDRASSDILRGWGLKCTVTADLVWALEARPLPGKLREELEAAKGQRLIGISLREFPGFTGEHVTALAMALRHGMGRSANLLLLPLQEAQDRQPLEHLKDVWRQMGGQSFLPDVGQLGRPSQWLDLLSHCDFVVGMRLHALIMALKSGVPVAGIVYDPKVSSLLTDFEQPALNLQNMNEWPASLEAAFARKDDLLRRAHNRVQEAKNLACQTFNNIARILEHAK